MNSSKFKCLYFSLIVAGHLFAISSESLAQRGIKELPVVVKPSQRPANERVVFRTVLQVPTKGQLAVALNYKVNATVVVKDASGRQVAKAEANEGQAEFQLLRGKSYQIEVIHPSYLGTNYKTKPLGATEIVLANLTPQFAALRLRALPPDSQVFIDNKERATADKSGNIAIENLKPGDHELLVRHPEYEDYIDKLIGLEAGVEVTYPPLRLLRVARIAIRGPAGANVMIDGDFWGRIKPDGGARINYELEQVGEHVISVEKIGYQPWTRRELLKPGVLTLEVKLDPIITSSGFSDFFEDLLQWSAPSPWQIVADQRNRKLEVRGEAPGLLANKTYRDFVMNFTVWLNDSRGATWLVRADKEGRSYYLFHLSGSASTKFTPRRFYTFLISNGGQPQSVSTPIPVIPELNNKTSYTINVVVQGNTIKHTITPNDTGETVDLGIWTDTSTDKDKFLYGTLGFRSLAGEIFAVDDLTVSLELPKEQ
ncbi:MAG: hypothetical protein ACREEM_01845 [Blastocatellia bacterium]